MPFTLKEKCYAYKISASIFYKVKGMVLKGVIYIFVNPNPNSVLAFSLKSQQVLEPMDTHHYPSALNVTEMKEIVPFYAWYEHFTCYFVNTFMLRDRHFELSLKFQKARTKIEVFLSVPSWLSQLNWDSQQGRDRKTSILLVAFWNFKLKRSSNTPEIVDFTPPRY